MSKASFASAGPMLSLEKAIHRAGHDYKGGVTALAFEMGIDYDPLQKKINANSNRYLSPSELEELVAITKDPRLLDALVRPAGALVFIPKPVTASSEALRAVGDLLHESGCFVTNLHQGAADSRWEAHEVEALRHSANKLIAAVLAILAGAELAMQGADHD